MSKIVVLDPGHGGTDPGAVNGQHKEKDYALQITKKVGELLSERGHKVRYTRTSDTFVSLSERAEFSNREGANVFISIHCNSAANKEAHGVETFSHPASSETSKRIAASIQKYLVRYTGDKDRGAKQADYYVLRRTNAKAALVEVGFISHDETAEKLANAKYQDDVARAIANGVIELYG